MASRDRLFDGTDDSLLKLGAGMFVVGLAAVGYALTVGVFSPVPVFTFDSRLLRWGLFLVGMLVLSVGLALTAQELETRRSGRADDG